MKRETHTARGGVARSRNLKDINIHILNNFNDRFYISSKNLGICSGKYDVVGIFEWLRELGKKPNPFAFLHWAEFQTDSFTIGDPSSTRQLLRDPNHFPSGITLEAVPIKSRFRQCLPRLTNLRRPR